MLHSHLFKMEILKQQQLLKAHNPSPEKLCGTEFSSLFSQKSLPLSLGENQFSKTDSLNRIYVRMVLSATIKKQQCNKALQQQILYLWICFLTKNRLESSSTYGRQQTPVNPKGIARPFQETGFFSIVCAGRGGAGRGAVSILTITPGSIYFRHMIKGPPVPVI